MSTVPPTDRRGIEIMSTTECERLLGDGVLGRVGVVAAGEPVIVPVVYRYTDGAVVFRTAAGEKLDVMAMNAPASFQIDDWDAATRSGWSVLVRGHAQPVYDAAEIARLEALGMESWVPDVQPTRWVRIRPTDISGRRIG